MIEHFRNLKFESYFNSLYTEMRVLNLQPEEAEGYLLDALPRIEQRHVRRCIERLNAKASNGSLDAAETGQLQLLTAILGELDRLIVKY